MHSTERGQHSCFASGHRSAAVLFQLNSDHTSSFAHITQEDWKHCKRAKFGYRPAALEWQVACVLNCIQELCMRLQTRQIDHRIREVWYMPSLHVCHMLLCMIVMACHAGSMTRKYDDTVEIAFDRFWVCVTRLGCMLHGRLHTCSFTFWWQTVMPAACNGSPARMHTSVFSVIDVTAVVSYDAHLEVRMHAVRSAHADGCRYR